MPKIFLSYSRGDLDQVLEFEQSLLARGVEVWRDQHSIRSGEQWPKAIGEALAACDAVLLAWSTNSANTAAVEFEWNTALALGKKIIPWMLDEMPLPASLKTFNWIKEPDTASAVARILQALPDAAPTDAAIKEQVIAQLQRVTAAEPAEALKQAQAIFTQSNIKVGGHFIQGGGDVQVTINEGRPHFLMFAVGLAAVLLMASLALIYWRTNTANKPEPIPAMQVIVDNAQGQPAIGAVIEVDVLPGQMFTTNSDGAVSIASIPRQPGDKIRIKVSKGKATADVYLPFPNPNSEHIVLR